MPHLALAFTVALTIGLVFGVAFDFASLRWPAAILAGSWASAALAYHRRLPRALLAALAMTAVAAGSMLGAAAVDRALHPSLRELLEQRLGGFAIDSARDGRAEEPVIVEGLLTRDASPTAGGLSLRVAVDRVAIGPCPEPAEGGITVSIAGSLPDEARRSWTKGRRVRMPALLRRPARYLDWGVADQERAMARRGLALVGTVKSAMLVELLRRGTWWEEGAAAVRAATREALARHVAPGDDQAAAIATALIIGDRAAIDTAVEQRLQEAGTYHVIAISGGNIAILAGLALGTLGWLRIRGRIAALLTIAMLAAYVVVANGGASVARATLMAVLYLALRVIDQRTAAANAIALSAAILLLIDPLSIFDVGFWLTFGATTAILAGAARLQLPAHSWRAVLLAVLAATVCAELALAPVAALTFQRVTLAGLPLNFVAIPCMSVVQIAAMAVVAFDQIGAMSFASLAAVVVQWATVGLIESTRLLDVAPWLTWRVPPPSPTVVTLYYAALASWWWTSRAQATSSRVAVRAAAALTLVFFVWIVGAPAARVRAAGDGWLHVSMIDVGQGDAMLVTFPNGRTLVVDTGGVSVAGDFDIGERVIGPALRARSLLRLDYLAVTHGDPDHVGGARSLVRDFAPSEVWWGVPVANHQPAAVVRHVAEQVRSTWRTLQRGDRFEIGGVEVRVHHPPLPDWERQKVRNNDSIVLEARFGDLSMLLTGDIGRDVEQELLGTLDLLPIVLVKVPHHGSATSSSEEFVERLQPALAFIGVGRSNMYGHPVPSVLGRYNRAGTAIFRTDQDGQIDLVTDGRVIQVRTFTGRVWDWQTDRHEGTKDTKKNHEGSPQ